MKRIRRFNTEVEMTLIKILMGNKENKKIKLSKSQIERIVSYTVTRVNPVNYKDTIASVIIDAVLDTDEHVELTVNSNQFEQNNSYASRVVQTSVTVNNITQDISVTQGG